MTRPRPARQLEPAELLAAAWVVLIYFTVPFVRVLQNWFTEHWDDNLIGYGVAAVVILAVAVGAVRLRRLPRPTSKLRLVTLAAIGGILLWWTYRLRGEPVEAVHIIEYGVLGLLLHRALRPRYSDLGGFVVAALLGALVGTVDEIIQWISPGRFWDLRDIVLNASACALAIAAVALLAPARPTTDLHSLRMACRLAVAGLVLLVICFANTPQRVWWYAARVPGLGFLTAADNAMAEYGYRHPTPGHGMFRSRFTLQELDRLDTGRGLEVAAVLDRYPPHRYRQFLFDFPSGRDPFIHEARVHVFNRNRNMALARPLEAGSARSRGHLTVAYREHQILEAHFPISVGSSLHRTGERRLALLLAHDDPERFVISKAGSHLITRISEGWLRTLLLAGVVILLMADVALSRREPR